MFKLFVRLHSDFVGCDDNMKKLRFFVNCIVDYNYI